MLLNRAWIEAHIPHQGRMCLLDGVLEWHEDRVVCSASSHRDADNPLRSRGRLGVASGIEYAAQTMAVHGALSAGALGDAPLAEPPAAGVLAGLRGIRFHVLYIDAIPGDLHCEALRVAGDARSALYDFTIRSEAACLMTGRATVLLDATRRLST